MPMTSAPAARASSTAAATSGTRSPTPAVFGTNSSPSSSGFQNPNVTFGASTSPSEYSLSAKPEHVAVESARRATDVARRHGDEVDLLDLHHTSKRRWSMSAFPSGSLNHACWQTLVSIVSPSNSTPLRLELGPRGVDVRDAERQPGRRRRERLPDARRVEDVERHLAAAKLHVRLALALDLETEHLRVELASPSGCPG